MRAYLRDKYYTYFGLLDEYYSDLSGNNDRIHTWYSNLANNAGLFDWGDPDRDAVLVICQNYCIIGQIKNLSSRK